MLKFEINRKKFENNLKIIFKRCWDENTAYLQEGKKGNPKNQCLVTACIIYEIYGGRIAYIEKFNHYWNEIDGLVIDVTEDQFTKKQKEELKTKWLDKYVTPTRYLKIESFKTRYDLLKTRFIKETIKGIKKDATKRRNR